MCLGGEIFDTTHQIWPGFAVNLFIDTAGFMLDPHEDEKFFRAGGPEITGRQWDRSPGPSHKVPVAVLRMEIGVELRPGRVGGWSRPMRRKRN
jgi:hypothetical protein